MSIRQFAKKAGSGFGTALGIGFAGYGTYENMENGDSLPVAAGKAVLENALWMMVPGGMGTMLGMTALQLAPELSRAYDAAASGIRSKSQTFSSGFQQNEGQMANLQANMNSMMQARQSAAAMMANHARNARKTYG